MAAFLHISKLKHPRLSASWLIAGLVVVFLFAKTAALIHDEIHPFHHHTEQCDLFQAMAHHTADTVAEFHMPLAAPRYILNARPLHHCVLPASPPFFWTRAPPETA